MGKIPRKGNYLYKRNIPELIIEVQIETKIQRNIEKQNLKGNSEL